MQIKLIVVVVVVFIAETKRKIEFMIRVGWVPQIFSSEIIGNLL